MLLLYCCCCWYCCCFSQNFRKIARLMINSFGTCSNVNYNVGLINDTIQTKPKTHLNCIYYWGFGYRLKFVLVLPPFLHIMASVLLHHKLRSTLARRYNCMVGNERNLKEGNNGKWSSLRQVCVGSFACDHRHCTKDCQFNISSK